MKRSEAAKAPTPAGVRVKSMRVVWGEEVHQPIQFNGFRVGAIEAEVELPPGADPAKVYDAVWNKLAELGQQQFDKKMQAWAERMEQAGEFVRR